MAESETEDVFLKIIEAVEPIEAENMNQCVAQIDVYLATKTEDERKSLTLLSAVGFRMEYEFYQARSEFWQPRSLEDKIMDSALRGWYRGVPLYDMQGPSLRQRPTLVVGDLRRLGRWNQFHAGRPGIDLEIIIEAITEARARELITARPEAFLVENGVRQTEEAAIRRWRKCVQLQVWQRYAFEIIEVVGAIRINLPKERIPDA
ncbi:MAG: hypothetical protein HY046_12150 [Acidobacteria bacterium]|nr:hypothetical protein [Acidobacteriota bacterium]